MSGNSQDLETILTNFGSFLGFWAGPLIWDFNTGIQHQHFIFFQLWHSTLAFQRCQRHSTLTFNINIQHWHSTLAYNIGMPSAAEAGGYLSPVGHIGSLCFLKITYRVGRRASGSLASGVG